eukprot:CAMPEP_0196788162 /NCGR_PEP_ID=MMETSP1104-20130614/24378_1 /TAXON_ID=33652 /ORGANISM="Cafeteria sp., Strain Caron Lab Isolate" /LENGTH=211 /DNA_ID=CAMNT_0042158505 /DNA_START=25 /DNA_END=657 /DNA_ORIENTATION=+
MSSEGLPKGHTRRCFYDVLGVERDASSAAIKKAFYKTALVWHPDKNAHRAEEATIRFQEVQEAYSVLSDPHERAWYDDHREAILRGGDGTADDEGTTAVYDVNLWPFFSPSCYSGYGNGEKGFYKVFQHAFDMVVEAETRESGKAVSTPPFGDGDSPWSAVSEFYRYWDAFVTRRTFAWLDKWNVAEAENRFARRAMEKENKKARAEGKRK